ncbi:unnamed protein product [Paramecium pentaurelia]|uniref:Uncharacterized protein n=1 Tax=Paramecium pentaurelia TaxID=43138 RepID=A0A8S1VBE0_9CILI|nr:unnamed protein product [Paramecium pentaurelia]
MLLQITKNNFKYGILFKGIRKKFMQLFQCHPTETIFFVNINILL